MARAEVISLFNSFEPVYEIHERPQPAGTLRLLSPTDCVKDRLAAFFHWDDLQALDQAVLVAQAQNINMRDVRRWSKAEGMLEKFETFTRKLTSA